MMVSLSTIVLAALTGSALAAPSGAGAQRQADVEASQVRAGATVNLAQADAQELLRAAIKLKLHLTENQLNQNAKRDMETELKNSPFDKISKDGERMLQRLFGGGKLETPQGVIAGKQRRGTSQQDQQDSPSERGKKGLLSGLLDGLLGGKKGALPLPK